MQTHRLLLAGLCFLLSACQNPSEKLRELADERYNQQDYAGAAEAYRQLLQTDSTQTELRFFLSACLQVMEQYPEAIRELDRVLLEVPDAYKAALNRGHAHYALGDYEAARRDYELVLELEPGYGLALNPLAHMQFYLGDTAQACRTLEEAASVMAALEVDEALRKACGLKR
jgi:tetratricopeptide (TPR) repeat protein